MFELRTDRYLRKKWPLQEAEKVCSKLCNCARRRKVRREQRAVGGFYTYPVEGSKFMLNESSEKNILDQEENINVLRN